MDNDTIDEIKSTLKEILDCLNGNGKPGLKTEIELLKAQIKTLRWLVGLLLVGLIGLAFKALGMV